MVFGVIISLVSFSACAQHSTPSYATYKEDADINLKGMNQQILYYINEYRSSIGKAELRMIEAAANEANEHSNHMARHATPFGHGGFDKRINTIIKQIGNIRAAAENVALGKLTAKQVVDGWLHSPNHKKNIEGDYNFTGIGVAKDNDGLVYYTQIFLNK
jgi:uncharacterized protein YkwD